MICSAPRQRGYRLSLALLLIACTPFLSGCRGGIRKNVRPRFELVEVPAAIDTSRTELTKAEAKHSLSALDRMRSASGTQDLPAELRREVDNVLEQAAAQLIVELTNPHRLEDLTVINLPRSLALEAGLRAARLYYEDGKRMRAFRLIRKLDQNFPQHHERQAAGKLLSEIGFDLAQDKGRYGLFFHYRGLAPQVLEYLVLNYPNDPTGDQALWTLAATYERESRWEVAIEKHQDLILWFSDSQRAAASEARIPHLRLAALGSPHYDRTSMRVAREELEAWLQNHLGHALEEEVRVDLKDAIQRLTDNDLIVARFYRRVKSFTGAEYHARRAVEQARDGGDPDQIDEAERTLSKILAWGEKSAR